MSYTLYERRDAIGVVKLNRPERLNAISGELLAAFSAALKAAIVDSKAAVIVLHGEGRAFCSGDDLKEFGLQSANAASIKAHISAIQEITHLMMGCDKPIVGALHGFAVGGGFEWLLNCDIIVAADNLVAFFPEMDWGQFVTGGVTHLLPQSIGYQRAMELLLLGERQSADQLLKLGLVNRVTKLEDMHDVAFEIAAKIATKSRFSVSRLKNLINKGLGDSLWNAVKLEEEVTIEAFSQPGASERVQGFIARKK
ncbi:4-chlorobenzoyl coenzyme A dehalogenase-1 [Pseudomonas fluorescens]|uniref:4-chlorobenzoyl coenzyme A dehalogenase-1 n=1 Tax=Pseudomonas fluorescens TaxID=294 RepID=A0A5E6RC95_PSEFL|nr:enoyl-CoA hydratase/isomerase family protein [Pseudomonas fluorescens]VVM66504.1 4-chlorobenzoyl coenzyme A dehalogenase-1 [Pseudomonas fluorescens]